MQTLKCVGAEEMKAFFSSNELLLSGSNADDDIEISDSIFDFSNIDKSTKYKTIQLQTKHSISFKRCIITGGLHFKNCEFRHLSFVDCHFVKPNEALPDFHSLSFSQIMALTLLLENCVLSNPLSVYKGSIGRVRLNYLTCPRVWLQSMNSNSELSVYRFLGKKIYLPTDTAFKDLRLDNFTLFQVEGNIGNHHIQTVRDN